MFDYFFQHDEQGKAGGLVCSTRDVTAITQWLMRTISICLLAHLQLFAFAALSSAQGTLEPVHITFDGPPLIAPGAGVIATNYYEAGVSFRPIPPSFGFSRYGAGYPVDPQNGTTFLKAALTQSLMFGFTNGSIFDMVSVDLAEYSTGQPYPLAVRFVGYRLNGSIVIADITTDGIIDGTGPLADFQTFTFGPEFSGLTRVEVPSWGWSLDNLHLSRYVPEPSSSALFLFGVSFVACRFVRSSRLITHKRFEASLSG